MKSCTIEYEFEGELSSVWSTAKPMKLSITEQEKLEERVSELELEKLSSFSHRIASYVVRVELSFWNK